MGATDRKVCSLAELLDWRTAVAGSVVFTNGVFDLLHPGHVALLEAARSEGDYLIVAVNDDDSVRLLSKGTDRPIIPLQHRLRMVAALEAVSRVVPFAEPTPLELIRAIKPDVLVKGGDYTASNVVGGDLLRARGGRVVIVPHTVDCSTTRILDRIRAPS